MVKVHPPATAGKGVATGVPPEIATHFGAIVNFLLAAVRAEFRAEREGADADPWVPHTKWPWPRRKSRELAASGVLLGARKLGKLWLARQSAIDAFIEEHGIKVPARAPANDAASAKDDPEADVDAVLAELGLERRAAGKGRGR